MTIRDWPMSERPREKLIENGARMLSDSELLAVLLGSGNRGHSAVDLARQLIHNFGSLQHFLTADRDACLEQQGIGPARYAALQAALELTRRHYLSSLCSGPALRAPSTTQTFLLAQLRDRTDEVFCCLHLNARHRLIAFEELFTGGSDCTFVPTKTVLRQVALHNASAVIFAHNHPSGVPDPSRADELMTRRLRDVLKLVDVQVLDHIIVGDSRCISFAELGLL